MLHRFAAFLVWLAGLAALAACVPRVPSSEANLRDERAFMPTVRVAIHASGGEERGLEPRSGTAFELSGAYARGDAAQAWECGWTPDIEPKNRAWNVIGSVTTMLK